MSGNHTRTLASDHSFRKIGLLVLNIGYHLQNEVHLALQCKVLCNHSGRVNFFSFSDLWSPFSGGEERARERSSVARRSHPCVSVLVQGLLLTWDSILLTPLPFYPPSAPSHRLPSPLARANASPSLEADGCLLEEPSPQPPDQQNTPTLLIAD